ncbi:hypothetical protein IW261DRAFT_1565144 [Armillaria novae-zelandiae]|uniref:Mid2 domain-containing protein n=1 Tax=Armillaria novae-zelandiae TaxID=153914 RepID=A0AA39P6Q4_9AGAR|nr:hypothetical protein IW261DRAFT_1565144 [Armillaria novae-zelandiae]
MRLLLSLLSLALFFSSTLAVLVNVTVDDQNGDPETEDTVSYIPADVWAVSSSCDNCFPQVDLSKAWDNTWHVGKFINGSAAVPLASYTFSGTAVYVNCILVPGAKHPAGRSDMTFFIDGVQAGTYSSEPDPSSPDSVYNVTVFAHENLPSSRHIIQIQSGHIGGSASLILLDSIIYSHNDDDGSSTQSTPVAMPSLAPNSSAAAVETSSLPATRSKIIGGVLGTLGGALVIGLACYAYLRWRRKSSYNLPITKQGPGTDQPGIARLGHHRRSYSFNPNLLIRKIINKPVNVPTMRDTRHHPPPLQAELFNTQNHGSPFPSGISSEDYSRLLSVQQWRRQTHEETASVVSPGLPDMSEELSSYYEDASESYRTRAPPRPRPPRRFTVMNG